MQTYYGTKKLNAKPMTLGEYNTLRGWAIPADEKAEMPGYLVEYLDGFRGNHHEYTGYISWSPKEVFELSYQPTMALSFGHAIEALKNGQRVARQGWNGMKPIITKYIPNTRQSTIFEGAVYTKLDDGSVVVCDEADYLLVAEKTWLVGSGGYAYFTNTNADGTRSSIKMHQLFLPNAPLIDHENGDRRDNRRFNLRPCTTQENNFNRAPTGRTSPYKGVSFDQSRSKFIAAIMVNGKTKHLGRFDDEKDAARAYDAGARELHGDFARLNFPEPRMFLFLVPGSTFLVNRPPLLGIYEEGTPINYCPHIDMKTADDKVVPWVASQTDVMANDWTIVG